MRTEGQTDTDRRMDTTDVSGAFRDYSNASKCTNFVGRPRNTLPIGKPDAESCKYCKSIKAELH
jgi:hypothetical protein